MWKSREQHCCKLRTTVLLLCILCLYAVTCEDNLPVLNYCCAGGSKYDVTNGRCAEAGITSKDVGFSQDETEIRANKHLKRNAEGENKTNSSFNTSNFANDFLYSFITLPKLVVIDFSDKNQKVFKFRTNLNLPTAACKEGKFIVSLRLRQENASLESNNETESALFSKTPIQFTSKGQLRIENDYYSSPEFCIAEFKKEELTIRVCNATCSEETPCIRKCCDLNEVWNLQRKIKGIREMCAPAGEHHWEPEFYKYPTVKTTSEERRAIYPHYKIIHPRQFCLNYPIRQSIEQRDEQGHTYWKFRVGTRGQLFRRKSRYTWDNEFPGAYCLDGSVNSRHLTGENQTAYSGLREDEIIFRCANATAAPRREQSALYASFMIISCCFLLLTIIVHILLYTEQSNRAWTLTLISYSVSLLFFDLAFAIMHISGFYIRRNNKINYFCYSIGVSVHFVFVSAFCWMSAVNYDIYSTFKALKPTAGKSKGLRRYLVYAAFSLTVPTVVVTVGIVMDNVYRYDYESGLIIPEYGGRKCNLDPEYAQLVYSYGPVGVLLVFNLICFFITIYKMYMIQKSTKFATATSSKKNKDAQSLKLFAKLLFVMGFPWIFEIISWYTEKDKASGNSWYWVGVDLLNICQAIAIFWIFVCKPDVMRQLEQKYPWLRRLLDRVMLDPDSAQKITDRHPRFKKSVKMFTRKDKETSPGTSRTGSGTDSSTLSAEGSLDRDKLEMKEAKPQESDVNAVQIGLMDCIQ